MYSSKQRSALLRNIKRNKIAFFVTFLKPRLGKKKKGFLHIQGKWFLNRRFFHKHLQGGLLSIFVTANPSFKPLTDRLYTYWILYWFKSTSDVLRWTDTFCTFWLHVPVMFNLLIKCRNLQAPCFYFTNKMRPVLCRVHPLPSSIRGSSAFTL